MSADFVQDGLASEELLNIVIEIHTKVKDGRDIDRLREIYAQRYAFFSERYPTLFNSLFQSSFDIDNFRCMMDMRKKIENNEETVRSASEYIGMKFFKQFHPDMDKK